MFIYSIHIMDEWNFLSIRFLPSCQTEPVASAYNKGGRLTKDWAEVRPSRRLPRRVASTGKGYLLLQHTYTRVVSLARLERLERIKERRATSAYHSRFSLRRLIGTRAPSPSPSKPASAALCSTCCWPTAGNWVGARVKSSRRGRERRVARRGGALPGAQAAGSLKEEENAGTSDSVRSMSELFSSVRFSEERFSSSPSSLKTLTSSSLPRSSPPPLLLTCGILRISLSLSLSLSVTLSLSIAPPLYLSCSWHSRTRGTLRGSFSGRLSCRVAASPPGCCASAVPGSPASPGAPARPRDLGPRPGPAARARARPSRVCAPAAPVAAAAALVLGLVGAAACTLDSDGGRARTRGSPWWLAADCRGRRRRQASRSRQRGGRLSHARTNRACPALLSLPLARSLSRSPSASRAVGARSRRARNSSGRPLRALFREREACPCFRASPTFASSHLLLEIQLPCASMSVYRCSRHCCTTVSFPHLLFFPCALYSRNNQQVSR